MATSAQQSGLALSRFVLLGSLARARDWLYFACAAAVVAYSLKDYIFHTDDAYISYQFAREIALGHGYVFHEGFKPVQGSSSPLHMLTLAALGFFAPQHVDTLGFFLCAVGAGSFSYAIFRACDQARQNLRAGQRPWLYAVAATSVSAAAVSFGLEAIWACTGLVWLYEACVRRSHRQAALLAALLFLIRPDWAYFGVLAGVTFVPNLRTSAALSWAIPVVVAAVYFACSYCYFGVPVPFSWVAKAHFPSGALGVLSYWKWAQLFPVLALSLAVQTGVAGLALVQLAAASEHTHRRFILCGYFFVGALAYTQLLGLQKAPNMPWYFVAPLSMGALLALQSLAIVRRHVHKVGALLLVLNCLAFAQVAYFFKYSGGADRVGSHDRREVLGRRLAQLDPQIESSSLLAYEDGKLAYFSKAPLYDSLGLVTPEALAGLERRDPAHLLNTIKPKYVVGPELPAFYPSAFVDDAEFRENYRVLTTQDDYLVWIRKDALPR